MEKLEYKKNYKIPVYEIAFDGKLAPHSLLNYLQDIASEHAEALSFGKDDLLKDNRFWVLSRLAVKIERWPEWEETVIVKTWPRGTDRLFALRDFEVKSSGGEIIALATSSWLVVDITTRRVQRPDSVLSHFNEGFPSATSIGRNADKIDTLDPDFTAGDPFRVNGSDLDINLHVNNVNYLRWIFDSYELDFRLKHRPGFIEINYLAESRYNEAIVIRTSAGKNISSVYNHSVVRTVDDTELCRVKINWADSLQ